MPFNAIPRSEFINRENEAARLRDLADISGEALTRNVLLLGPSGIGKTELMRQLYGTLFWEEGGPLPFYYRFRRATLKAGHFARDYFSRFVRQFAAGLAGDPSLAGNMGVPLHRLVPTAPDGAAACLSELIGNFDEQLGQDDPAGQVLASISAPLALSECAGRRLVVMLDDFHLAEGISLSEQGDTPGVAGLFEASMGSRRLPHIIAGSPESAMEAIFADDSLRGLAERLTVGPLGRDDAFGLFRDTCARLGAPRVGEDCGPLMKHLCGNPLYIRNMANAAAGTGAGVTPRSFMDCYAREVSEGETASYWMSLLGAGLRDNRHRRLALDVLALFREKPQGRPETGRLARQYGISEEEVRSVVGLLGSSGMMPAPTVRGRTEDTVLDDVIMSARMLEISGEGRAAVRGAVVKRRFGRDARLPLCFEMVIPRHSDAELVAAKALEQVCAGAEMEPGEVQRLLTALIEACINAMEHGRGFDDRVSLSFEVYSERLEVAVESQGRMADPGAVLESSGTMPGLDSARGRGFSLMGRFVDDVRVENINDRTRVVLVKTIKPVKETK